MNKNYIKLNNLGMLVDSELHEVSQGNNNVDSYYIAYDVYDYTNGSVTAYVTLPDGTKMPPQSTSPCDFEFKGSNYKGFLFTLLEPLTSIAGVLTITFSLSLLENDAELCSYQQKIDIHATDTPARNTITDVQYEQMQETIRQGFVELNRQYEETWENIEDKIKEEGLKGEAATINLGSVATGNAGTNVIITNTGTESDAVFNFIIPRGDTGPQGPKGDTGATGPQGPKGDNGSSFKVVGTVDLPSELPTLTASDVGTAYYVGDTEPREIYSWGYNSGILMWTNQGYLQGPEGPVGPQGPIGPQGPTGEPPADYVRCVDAIAIPEPDVDPLGNYYNKSQVDSKIANFTTREYVDTGLGLKQNKLTAGANITISDNTISATVPGVKKPLKQLYTGDLAISPTSGATINNVNLVLGKVYVFEGQGIYAVAKAETTSLNISGVTCYNNEFRIISYIINVTNSGSNLKLTSTTNTFNIENNAISGNESNNITLYIKRIYEMEVE